MFTRFLAACWMQLLSATPRIRGAAITGPQLSRALRPVARSE